MTTNRPVNRFSSNFDAARIGLLEEPQRGLNGAWWPRTRDLGTELLDLNEVFIGKYGLMHRITVSPGDWENPSTGSCRATRAGSFVHLTTSHTLAVHTVQIDTLHNASIRLLVVPPAFGESQARWAFQLLLQSTRWRSAEQILHLSNEPRPERVRRIRSSA